jgi:hypothetical protein
LAKVVAAVEDAEDEQKIIDAIAADFQKRKEES